MNTNKWAWAGLTAIIAGTIGVTQAQAAPPSAKASDTRARAQVLVLGSAHLAQVTPQLPDASLETVIDRLVAFRPDIIAIENLPGESCDTAARHPTTYDAQEFSTYCLNLEVARRSTGLDVPAALAEMNQLLKQWPTNPNPAQRRRLAAVAMAAGEDATAALQWRQLPPSEQREGDGVDAALAAQLKALGARKGEVTKVALPVAQRLSLARLHAMDDHSGDNVAVSDGAAYGRAIQTAWDGAKAQISTVRDREAQLLRAQDAMGLYRHMNDPAALRVALASDFGAAAAEPSPEKYGRIYVGGWETRNLRMAANIRATFRERPDARVLVIVGASHKPLLEQLLGMLEGVEIVDALQVLR